jgi:ssDNA-binding Zn-finger/Zn-ribbon topoisomerase 1
MTDTPQAPVAAAPAPAAEVRCPQCGTPMAANPAMEKREMIRQMIRAGSTAAYAENFVEEHYRKEAELGTVYTCPKDRYIMRVEAGA